MPEYNFIVIGFVSKSGARPNSRKARCSVGISPTYHRVKIADLVFQRQQHATAEKVCEQLNAESRPVSRATVYNTRKILIEHGLLRQGMIETNRVFFDSNTSPHYHFFDTDIREPKD